MIHQIEVPAHVLYKYLSTLPAMKLVMDKEISKEYFAVIEDAEYGDTYIKIKKQDELEKRT